MDFLQKATVTAKKVLHRVAQWPSKTTHMVYSLDSIKRKTLGNRARSIETHRGNLSVLTTEEAALAHCLKERGYSVTNANAFDLFGSENFAIAGGAIFDMIENNYVETGENINIISLLNVRPALMDQFKIIFRAGLDIKMLKIIENYLQLPVAYGGMDIFFTVADGVERGARTWHRDSEDSPMVKVAVYFNDVGDDDGPLEIVHLQQGSSHFENIRGFKQQKLIQLQSENKIKFEITSFTGPVGNVVLCDTSKYYHRGKPATGKHRRALFFNYYARMPLTPYFCPNPPLSSEKMKALVADLSATQQRAALWRDDLTKFDKIVTKRKPYLNL